MKENKKSFFLCFLFLLISFLTVAQENTNPHSSFVSDFKNQKISDIIFVLADVFNEQVITDETVTGNASFHFSDTSFDEAITKFASHCNLFIEKEGGIYSVSRISVQWNETAQSATVDAEDVSAQSFFKILSRKSKKTIVTDFPSSALITVRTQNADLAKIIKLVLVKESNYELIEQEGGYYIARKSNGRNDTASGMNNFRLDEKDDIYSLSLKKASYSNVIQELFRKAGKEYSLMNKSTQILENLYYSGKDFDTMLHLINEQASSDFTVTDGIYYIYDIQKKDILKNFKATMTVTLQNISATEMVALFPSDYNVNNFIKINKNSNSLIITGSTDEVKRIIAFINQIDVPLEGRRYEEFSVSGIDTQTAVSLFPAGFFFTSPIIVPNSHVFITQVTDEKAGEISDFLKMLEKKDIVHPVQLKFIKSETLIKNIPPSIKKENINTTNDESLVFFIGDDKLFEDFKKELALIDKPQKQIKYQLLVIQRQLSDSFNWESTMTGAEVNTDPDAEGSVATGRTLSWKTASLLNISFDIVKEFGLQFAETISTQIGNSTSKIMADTTLNGISGESITFKNTNTYRYRDVAVDANSGLYTSSTKEITSGLVIKIKGWVSGDDMVTVDVTAEVSKQGSVDTSSDGTTTNPPSTTEKSVTTNVRTQSGSAVVISGLLQEEVDENIKKTPILGSIPIIGKLFQTISKTTAQTEMVIYLVPFVQKSDDKNTTEEENIARYTEKYGDCL